MKVKDEQEQEQLCELCGLHPRYKNKKTGVVSTKCVNCEWKSLSTKRHMDDMNDYYKQQSKNNQPIK